jgi:TRAP-type C4-dicarboxylate transport system permease small subunit
MSAAESSLHPREPQPVRKPLWLRLLGNSLEILAAAMLVAICLAVFTQVFTRYFLHIGLGWTEEAARYLQIWMMFVGATIGVKRWGHFQLNLLDERLAPGSRRVVRIIAILVVMVISAALLMHGIALVDVTWEQTSPMMEWRIGHVYLVVPTAGALMLLFALGHLIDALRNRPVRKTGSGH